MFNKDEKLDNKELNLTLTVYDEMDIEMDRIALSNQYFDGFTKAKDFSKDQEFANLVRRLSAIDILSKKELKKQLSEALRKK